MFSRANRAYCQLNLGAAGLYVFLVVLLVVPALVLDLTGPSPAADTFPCLYDPS